MKEGSKGNVEIEGLIVPDEDVILDVIKKYKDRLGDESVDSLLYILNSEINNIRELEKNENTNRKTSRK